MAVINEVISFEQAQARNLPTWEVQFQDFGYDNGSGQVKTYPEVIAGSRGLPTVYGVAIGPKSLLDRCIVLYDPQVILKGPALSPPDFLHRLSRRAPLMYTQLGNKARASSSGLLSALNPITALRVGTDPAALGITGSLLGTVQTPTTFTPEGTTVAETFIPIDRPLLHLVFFMQPPVFSPPLARFEYDGLIDHSFLGSEAETYIGSFPVMGRDTITLILEAAAASGNASVTYRIAGMRCDSLAGTKEVTLATSASVSRINPDFIKLERQGMDWINIWAAPGITSPPTAVLARVRCRAEDT